jgi:hypothetical protein
VRAGRREHHIRGIGEPRGFRLQSFRRKEPGRRTERLGQGMDRRLPRLELDRCYAGDRLARQAVPRQRSTGQRHKLFGRRAALAADAQGQHLRMDHQTRGRALLGAVGQEHLEIAARREGCTSRGEPVGPACLDSRLDPQPDRAAVEQGTHDRFRRLGIAHHEARRRIVERQIEAHVARGGDRGGAAKRVGRRPGETIGAAVTAQQRHRDAAVLGDHDHRRLAALVGQHGRQHADHDPGGAQREDRRAGPVQRAQMRCQLVIGDGVGRIGHTSARHVQRGSGQGRPNPLGCRQAAWPEQHDRRRSGHRPDPRGIRISEK